MKSMITAARRTPPPAKEDPFRLGWRYVEQKNEEGDVVVKQVPLTEEDVLHPQEEDFIVNTPLHDDTAGYLKLGIQSRCPGRKDIVVLGNTRVDWGSPHGWAHGPDVALFDHVKGGWSRARGTFYLRKTGGRALLAMEVTSPATRAHDFGHKLREYYLVGVSVYVIVDLPQEDERGDILLFAFQAGPTQYEPLAKDARGRIWLDAAGLWLGAEGTKVYLEDAQGNRLPEYEELAKRLEQEARAREKAEQEARAEVKAREKAEQEARTEVKAREKAEREAKAQAKARKQAEKKTRDAEKRLHEMEKELVRLRKGEKP